MRDDGNLHPEDLKPLLSSKTSLMACTVASNVFFFNDAATTEIYTLSLHDALPIWEIKPEELVQDANDPSYESSYEGADDMRRSEEHTSELQSLAYLVCRLLLEKKKKNKIISPNIKKKNINK